MDIVHVGYPIQKSTDRWIFAPPRGLSQLITSFIGSWCQGIPLALFIAWPIENSRSLARSRLWIMQASQILWNCNCYPHLFRCCSTIKITFFCAISGTDLSVALLHFVIHCSVFKVQSFPTSLEVRLKHSIPWMLQSNFNWWRLAGSNRWPPACKAGALPAELNPHIFF